MSGFLMLPRFSIKTLCGVSAFLACGLMFSSCDLAQNYQKPDRGANMEIQDFRDGLAERLPEIDGEGSKKGGLGDIPSLQPYISTNAVSQMKPMPLVSVSVNQSVPLRDILFELAKQADYDIELDPRIRGSIIFTARNKPFDVVVERIANVAGLRYKFEDNFVRVELDKPYNKTYKLDYLSYMRTNKSSLSTDVSVVSGDGAQAGSGFNSSSESVADFWKELETNLAQILGAGTSGGLRTGRDPRISAVEQNPDVAAVAPQVSGEAGASDAAVAPPDAVLRVESLPVDDEEMTEEVETVSTFSLNKQAGMINVYASEKTQKEVERYLNVLRRSVTAQVLVEAKIFEVNLFDEYITGIDWGVLGLSSGEGSAAFMDSAGRTLINNLIATPGLGAFTSPVGSSLSTGSNVVLGYAGNDVQALLQAISGFGTVRALASPRLTVLNNQSAVLNVATNKVYFEIDLDVDNTSDAGTTVSVDSNIKSVPEGVLVNVIPSINLEDRTISMAVRPTVTRITGTQEDPAVTYAAALTASTADFVSEIPEVNVQEIDTVVKVRSGQPIVMGGLLQDRSNSSQESVPVLGEVPVVGSLFRKHNDLVQKTELVIFLKATLIDSGDDTIHDTDRDLYKTFSGDRRPLKL